MADVTPTRIHRIAMADGIHVQIKDYSPVGDPTGAPCLLLHGLTRNSKDFEPLVPHLLAAGRRVLAMDVRGRGGSDRDPKPENYHPGTYVGDVMTVMAVLGVSRAVFIGTSMGGLITAILATVAPQLIAGAVLNDIGPEVDPAGLARIQSYVGEIKPMPDWATATAAFRMIGEAAFPNRPDSFWDDFARRTCIETERGVEFDYDPAIAVIARQSPPDQTPDLWPLWAAMGPIPTASIRGALSDLFAPATQARMRDAKPDLIVAVVPDTGHAPVLDEPEALAAIHAVLAASG
jgi:pimeloyl-ACP methyl ester carboxylesterase